MQVGHKQIAGRLCKGRLAKDRLPESEETIVRQCLTEEQTRKGGYKGSLRKANIMVNAQGQFGELRSWEVGLKQLISFKNQNVGLGW